MNEVVKFHSIENSLQYPEKFLLIGQLHVSVQPTYVWTVLGSCVSVILYSPRKRISGICHAQLAEKKTAHNNKCSDVCPKPCHREPSDSEFRYVTCSVNYMMEQLLKLGAVKSEIQASVYGGSTMLTGSPYDIGGENLRIAYKMIENYGLRVVNFDTGGTKGRSIRHFSDTGITLVKTHKPAQ
jgi:chemotaxis protein CheD